MTNMKLWDAVCKTDPSHTKKANVRGNQITSIRPQYQIRRATEQWGAYGGKWGFNGIQLDYSLASDGLVVFRGEFFYPGGKFPIITSIGIYRDNAKTKIDDDFGKKIETDALTKALSKLGFSADVFMGQFDDCRYVQALQDEISKTIKKPAKTKADPADEWASEAIAKLSTLQSMDEMAAWWKENVHNINAVTAEQKTAIIAAKDKQKSIIEGTSK